MCVYVCLNLRLYVCALVCLYARVYVCLYVRVCELVCVRMAACMCALTARINAVLLLLRQSYAFADEQHANQRCFRHLHIEIL